MENHSITFLNNAFQLSGPELRDFAARPVRDGEERNWRALDPRRDEDGEYEDE